MTDARRSGRPLIKRPPPTRPTPLNPCTGGTAGARCGLVLLLIALAGCAAAPPPGGAAAAADLPLGWSMATPVSDNSPGRALETTWWQRFDDPLLARLVTQALQANSSVLTAQAALRQARALRDVAAAALSPTLDSSASAQRSRAGTGQAGISTSRYSAGLDASWELDIFGATRSALDASAATAQASAASLGDVQVSIAAEVALAYITLRSGQARLAIAEANLASQQDTLQITRWRQQAGLIGSLEAEQALAAAESTRAALPALQAAISQTGHALAVLTGQPPAALDATLAETRPVPSAADDLALSGPADTLRQRADVRAAEQRLAAEIARLAQADAARLPSFRLGGSLGLAALSLSALSSGSAVVGSVLAGVSLPVFDGGAARARVVAQQAQLDQASAAYRATTLAALQQVEDALVALRSDRERQRRLQAAAQAASNAALMASQRYSSGLVDFQAVLDTQRTQLNAQDSLAQAGADLAADHVRLYKALGGGWRADSTGALDNAPAIARNPKP